MEIIFLFQQSQHPTNPYPLKLVGNQPYCIIALMAISNVQCK